MQKLIAKLLNQAGLKPYKMEYWYGKIPDPEFEDRMIGKIGLYMNPPKNPFNVRTDEKIQIRECEFSNNSSKRIKNRTIFTRLPIYLYVKRLILCFDGLQFRYHL
jgi:hypothetical protein